MKWFALFLAAALPLGTTGCMNDQTKRMAESCQDWLQRPDKLGLKSFIQDADKQIASLNKRQNKVMLYFRDLLDPDALKYKPSLEQCVWLLKYRQT